MTKIATLLATFPAMDVHHTGGGCTAYHLAIGNTHHILVTDGDANTPTDADDDVIVGVYDNEGETDGAWYEVKLDDAIAKINEILSRDRRHFTTVDQVRAMSRRQLIDWLTWNDRNGCYDDEAHTAEFGDVALTEDLRAIAIEQIKGA